METSSLSQYVRQVLHYWKGFQQEGFGILVKRGFQYGHVWCELSVRAYRYESLGGFSKVGGKGWLLG